MSVKNMTCHGWISLMIKHRNQYYPRLIKPLKLYWFHLLISILTYINIRFPRLYQSSDYSLRETANRIMKIINIILIITLCLNVILATNIDINRYEKVVSDILT